MQVRNTAQFVLAGRMEFLENAFIETIQLAQQGACKCRSFSGKLLAALCRDS